MTKLLSSEFVDWKTAEKIFVTEKDSIFESLKNCVEKYPLIKDILILLAAGTFIGGCLIFPGLPIVVSPLAKELNKYQGYRLRQTVKRLEKQKLVEVVIENGEPTVKITSNGRVRALRYKLDGMKINKQKTWDKKWRIIIFDVPEEKRGFRDVFRKSLTQLEMVRLQDSVFVSPYPCFGEIEFLRQIYSIPIEVRYILAEAIDNQESLINQFDL